MPGRSRSRLAEAEYRFPVRLRVAVPPGGFGRRLDRMHAWLDENCGADGWMIAPAGLRGVVNDAIALYFLDPTVAAAFVARWCVRPPPETAEAAFVMRDDEPAVPRRAPPHRTP